jgi:hypothetical protein
MLRTSLALVLGKSFTCDMKMQRWCFTVSRRTTCSCTQESQRGITARKYSVLYLRRFVCNKRHSSQSEGQHLPYLDKFYAVTSAEANYYSSSIHLIQTRSVSFWRNHFITFKNIRIFRYWSCHISSSIFGPTTAVAVFRNPNTIPFCLTTDLLLDV